MYRVNAFDFVIAFSVYGNSTVFALKECVMIIDDFKKRIYFY